MNSLLYEITPFFEWLVKSTLQASVIICIVLAVKMSMGSKLTPRWHYILWMLVIVKMVMPVSLQSSFSIFNLMPKDVVMSEAVIEHAAEVAVENETQTIPDSSIELKPVAEIVEDEKSDLVADAGSDVATAAVSKLTIEESEPVIIEPTKPSSPGKSVSESLEYFKTLMPYGWLIGAVFLGIYVVVSNFKLWRIIRVQRPVTDSKVLDLLEDCKAQMEMHAYLAVVETDKVNSPALFGFLRPRLLLPVGIINKLSNEQLRHVFLHELAHLKRGDIYYGWLTALLQTMHWFNPLVWYGFYKMRVDRELACDQLALSAMESGDNCEYGRTIVSLLEGFSAPQYTPGLAGILEDKSQLKRRISMIANYRKGSLQLSMVVAVLMLVIGVVSLTDGLAISTVEISPSTMTELPTEIKPMAEVVVQWYNSCRANDVEGVRNTFHPDRKSVVSKKTLNEMNEILSFNRKWEFELLSVMWDDSESMVVSKVFIKNDIRIGKNMSLIWPLRKDEDGKWKLLGFGGEEIEGMQFENAKFIKEHPDAKMWCKTPWNYKPEEEGLKASTKTTKDMKEEIATLDDFVGEWEMIEAIGIGIYSNCVSKSTLNVSKDGTGTLSMTIDGEENVAAIDYIVKDHKLHLNIRGAVSNKAVCSISDNIMTFIITTGELTVKYKKEKEKRTEPFGSLFHMVRPGETLSSIAEKYYGDGKYWEKLYQANKEAIGNVEQFRVGLKLEIPEIEEVNPEKITVYAMGKFMRPGPYQLDSNSTLKIMIASAGGPNGVGPDKAMAKITHRKQDGTEDSIVVSLKDLFGEGGKDYPLQANDLVTVYSDTDGEIKPSDIFNTYDDRGPLVSASETNIFKLKNGVTVELLGVNELSVPEVCWKPDGALLDTPLPLHIQEKKYQAELGQMAYEFSVQLHGLPEHSSTKMKATPDLKVYNAHSTPNGKDKQLTDHRFLWQAFNEKQKKCDLTVSVSCDKWKTVGTGKNEGVEGIKGIKTDDSVPGFVTLSPLAERRFNIVTPTTKSTVRTVVSLTHNIVDKDVRIIAIDKAGETHLRSMGPGAPAISRNFNDGITMNCQFDLAMKDIDSLELQVRPYRSVTFTDVALKAKQNREPGLVANNARASDSSKLEFRIAADKSLGLDESELSLDSKVDGYMWMPIGDKFSNFEQYVNIEKDNQVYLLVSTHPNKVMLADGSWGIANAYVSKDNRGMPMIMFIFDDFGSEQFLALTGNNIERALAICIDDEVISAPRIMTKISGRGAITGSFSMEEAEGLAEKLKKGMPPAKSVTPSKVTAFLPSRDQLKGSDPFNSINEVVEETAKQFKMARWYTCKLCNSIKKVETYDPDPEMDSSAVKDPEIGRWAWQFKNGDWENCRHEWKAEGISLALPEKISNGKVVLVKLGDIYGAFMLVEQNPRSSTAGKERAWYVWRFRIGGDGTFDVSDPAVKCSTKPQLYNLTTEEITFGPFGRFGSALWSSSGKDGVGYLYYPTMPGNETEESLAICMTNETSFDDINPRDIKWIYKRHPFDTPMPGGKIKENVSTTETAKNAKEIEALIKRMDENEKVRFTALNF